MNSTPKPSDCSLSPTQREFISFAINCGLIKFGQFTLKSGRLSPYFIDLGAIHTGRQLSTLIDFYYRTIAQSSLWQKYFVPSLNNDQILAPILYGPPYKGILLSAGLSMKINDENKTNQDFDCPFLYSRKEVKDHGEGGQFVGFPLEQPTQFDKESPLNPIIIIDDVLTAGTAVTQSIQLLKKFSKYPIVGLIMAIDREEKPLNISTTISSTGNSLSSGLSNPSITTKEYLETEHSIVVEAIIKFSDLLTFLNDLKASTEKNLTEKEQVLKDWLVHENGLDNIYEYWNSNTVSAFSS